MEAVVSWFAQVDPGTRSALLAAGFVLCWALEGLIPLYRFGAGRGSHAALNLFFWATTLVINLAFAVAMVSLADWAYASEFGLVHLVEMPLWIQVVVGLLLLDLIGAWFVHWVEHRVKWMWKFHLIHHTDRSVDVTTGLRHHPGESVFRAAFTLAAVGLVGAPIGVVMLYQTLSALFAQLTHANIRVPDALDRPLSWLLVTPNMHKVHHHFAQPLTDTNYGNVFAVWDRLFGTYAYHPAESLTYGIDTHLEEREHTRLDTLMSIPFQAYRPPPGSKFNPEATRERSGGTDPAHP